MNKNIRKIIILLVVLIIISFAAFFTTKYKKEQLIANKPRTQIFELNETNVNKYHLVYDNEDITVEKKNNIWTITSPENNYKIDQMEAFANVKNFNTLNIDLIITNLSEVSSFGLDNPSNEFTVWDGKKEHKIYVGNKTPDGERYYVKYNDEYFSVEYIYIEAIKKTIDMLRDKEIFESPIVLDSVKMIEIATKDYTNTINKLNRTNWVVDDLGEQTDLDKAYRDFTALALVKASAFVYDQDLMKQLFKIPDAVITIYMQDNTKEVYELIYTVDDRIYVKPKSDIVYEVDYSIYDAAMRSKDYYEKSDSVEDNEEALNSEDSLKLYEGLEK
ncbi:DUF4340 domain-containing protein [Brachyspira pilosicoli]|uniref:DUF4340 domain-containing protein n=1 Tax=Brachyspira pilosicoli TaxID=52584 RepID=A0A5C8F4H2_BRAPL|nr:DUF4340 domain-containing protein [Brachyspira pilosicoli]TXJ45197.1 DUF4340 domain-containing protein [Brachyspira pilosicoli]